MPWCCCCRVLAYLSIVERDAKDIASKLTLWERKSCIQRNYESAMLCPYVVHIYSCVVTLNDDQHGHTSGQHFLRKFKEARVSKILNAFNIADPQASVTQSS